MSSAIGDTPVFLYDSAGNEVEPAKAYIEGGEHLNIMPWEHFHVHQGHRFRSCFTDLSLAQNGTIELIVTIGSTHNAHMVVTGVIGGDGNLEVFRGPTTITGGTANLVTNKNEESALTSDAVSAVLENPTSIGDDGTFREGRVIPGGGVGITLGGVGEERDERIYLRDTLYLVRLTHLGSVSTLGTLCLDWYDHLPVGIGVT